MLVTIEKISQVGRPRPVRKFELFKYHITNSFGPVLSFLLVFVLVCKTTCYFANQEIARNKQSTYSALDLG